MGDPILEGLGMWKNGGKWLNRAISVFLLSAGVLGSLVCMSWTGETSRTAREVEGPSIGLQEKVSDAEPQGRSNANVQAPTPRQAYYVSPDGSDSNPGTLEKPFLSIQKAATVMVTGDTVFIRAGTYRETVRPASSGTAHEPITFEAFKDEVVIVSGADRIDKTSWVAHRSAVYRTPLLWTLGEGRDQVFVDGRMMIEARWPNTSLDVSHPNNAISESGSFQEETRGQPLGSIRCPSLPERPQDYWQGANIHIALGPVWVQQTGSVHASKDHQLTFNFEKSNDKLVPAARNPFYLSGKLGELDAPGEWYRDPDSATLYLWTPVGDSPALHHVEVKRRPYAFDLRSRSHIVVKGIRLFAATVITDHASERIVLDGLRARYLSHYTLVPRQPWKTGTEDTGVILMGRDNVLKNSRLAFSAGNGVTLLGQNNTVENCVIHDTNYTPTDAAGIFVGSPSIGHVVSRNTLYNSGRSGLVHRSLRGGKIIHNEIYNAGLQMRDVGLTYTFRTDGMGTEISHNLLHDNKAASLAKGIYLDNGSSHHIVHHNVVWNVESALCLNSPSHGNLIYNNTFIGNRKGLDVEALPGEGKDLTLTEIKNNLFTGETDPTPRALLEANLYWKNMSHFVDPARHNYQLRPTSPAIDAGVSIHPYTEGFAGTAPDIGAYEYGREPWTAGAHLPAP